MSYELFDGLLRPRQTQAPGPEGGRLVTDTFYDDRGLVAKENDVYYAIGPPSADLLVVPNGSVDRQVVTTYDGAGREVARITEVAGQEKWRTVTSYGGDRVHVDPPTGGTPTTTISDARGNTVELRRHLGTEPSGPYEATTYDYDPAGRLSAVTDAAGNTWGYAYDLRGREVQADDPDSGATMKTYDDLDRLVSVTDARGETVANTYDALGRRTGLFEGSASGTKLAEWTYDTRHVGHLYMATRFVDGEQYRKAFVYRDDFYRPTRTVYGIPEVEGPLAGTYSFPTVYNRDGTVQSVGGPAAGGLPAEGVVYTYDELHRPVRMVGRAEYVSATQYSQTGLPLQYELDGRAWLTFQFEQGTDRSRLDRVGLPVVRDAHYAYDPAGNITRIADTPSGGPDDVQCFSYDHLRRLSQAWTPASGDCDVDPASAVLGGVAPYWHSYSYDAAGNRMSETLHGVGGVGDTVRSYQYPAAGEARPHAPVRVDETGPSGSSRDEYAYDPAGNLVSRSLAGDVQALSWDVEGRLASVSGGSGDGSFLYGADGERLIRREPGATTVYLPGMELRLDTVTGDVKGTRYYTVNGTTVAVRTPGGVSFLASDHHETNVVAVDAASLDTDVRRQGPFGGLRGPQPGTWPDDKGFVGGTQDATGLVHVGARYYDPAVGGFISPDPLLAPGSPETLNAYAYAGHNPVSRWDPSGLCVPDLPTCWAHGHQIGEADPTAGNNSSGGGSGGGGGGDSAAPEYPAGTPSRAELAGYGEERRRQAREGWLWELASRSSEYEQYRRAFCYDYPGYYACQGSSGEGQERLEELVGINDAQRCVGEGDAGSCFWFAGGFIPVGKVLKGFKLFKGADDVKAATRTCGANSFVPGTTVLMADCTRKPIDGVKLGDEVLATDPTTGETTVQEVVGTIVGRGEKSLVEITVDTDGPAGDRTGVVVATAGHPFWNTTSQTWTNAGNLQPGTQLATPTATARGLEFSGQGIL